MGISPIDLQTLYTQMDKVGKAQLSQAAALEQARDAAEDDIKKAAEAKAKSVQKAETGENAVGKVDDQKERPGGEPSKKEEKEAKEKESPATIKDSDKSASSPLNDGLGNNIDISV